MALNGVIPSPDPHFPGFDRPNLKCPLAERKVPELAVFSHLTTKGSFQHLRGGRFYVFLHISLYFDVFHNILQYFKAILHILTYINAICHIHLAKITHINAIFKLTWEPLVSQNLP